MNAFDEHARNLEDYENEFLADKGVPASTLSFPTINQNPPLVVTVTHTKVDSDFSLLSDLGGFSNTTAIERCEFRSSQVPRNLWDQLKKGLRVTFTMSVPQGNVTLNLQLWTGGLVEGGRVFRYMLVAASYKG